MSGTLLCLTLTLASAICEPPLYPSAPSPYTTWVQDGQARAVIVAPEPPEAGRDPGAELQHYLQAISGAKLPLLRQPAPGKPQIFVGGQPALQRLGTDWAQLKLGRDGFLFRTVGPDVVIAGETNFSTLLAVYAFLERHLGCRWYWPGKIGEVIPQRQTVAVGRLDETHRPDFALRWVGSGDWALHNGCNVNTKQPGEFRTKYFVHTFARLLPADEYFDQHPEYFPLINGRRVRPTKERPQVNLCTSNPGVAEAVARTIDRLLEADPSLDMISVDPMDTQTFCQCDACRALDEPGAPYERKVSRRLVLFYNRVGELVRRKHPELLLKSIAYHSYVAPPADASLRLGPNNVIQFCRFQCHSHSLNDSNCPLNAGFNRWLIGWTKICDHVMLYEYYYKASWVGLPWPIVHTLRADLPYFKRLGLMGLATQYTSGMATNGLDFYVAAKLLWDADCDVDALLDDYFSRFFGPAAAPMRKYHDLLERRALESGVHLAGQRPYGDIVRFFTPETMTALEACIAEAEAAARGDDNVARRVAVMRTGLEYTKLCLDYLGILQRGLGARARLPWGGTADRSTIPPEAESAAKRIDELLRSPRAKGALVPYNTYTQLFLSPENVARNFVSDGLPADIIVLRKTDWLKQQDREIGPTKQPETFALWIYGNDLDTDEGKPEHPLSLRDRGGKWVSIGGVAPEGENGNRRNRCFVLSGLKRGQFPPRDLELRVENAVGGPYASHFYAFYLMPDSLKLSTDQATALLENHLDWVRAASAGFTEYSFRGLRSDDGDQDIVPLTWLGLPAKPPPIPSRH